jgi:hypothetical protein
MVVKGAVRVVELYPSKDSRYPETAVTCTDISLGGQFRFKVSPSLISAVKIDDKLSIDGNFASRVQGFGSALTFVDGKIEVVK